MKSKVALTDNLKLKYPIIYNLVILN